MNRVIAGDASKQRLCNGVRTSDTARMSDTELIRRSRILSQSVLSILEQLSVLQERKSSRHDEAALAQVS